MNEPTMTAHSAEMRWFGVAHVRRSLCALRALRFSSGATQTSVLAEPVEAGACLGLRKIEGREAGSKVPFALTLRQAQDRVRFAYRRAAPCSIAALRYLRANGGAGPRANGFLIGDKARLHLTSVRAACPEPCRREPVEVSAVHGAPSLRQAQGDREYRLRANGWWLRHAIDQERFCASKQEDLTRFARPARPCRAHSFVLNP